MRKSPAVVRLRSVRPLVRYVDAEQAVIDVHFMCYPILPTDGSMPPVQPTVETHIEVDHDQGFHDEGGCAVQLDEQYRGSVRFELVHPEVWWPSGLGEQCLYNVSVHVGWPGQLSDHKSMALGLTSVREDRLTNTYDLEQTLLVNGQVLAIEHVVHVDRISENRLLPAGGGSLLMVRDHFGTDTLYQAADRAGILLVQCIPVPHDESSYDTWVEQAIDRIAPHPSLAGYYVGHLGDMRDRISDRITAIDPTHAIFNELPMEAA